MIILINNVDDASSMTHTVTDQSHRLCRQASRSESQINLITPAHVWTTHPRGEEKYQEATFLAQDAEKEKCLICHLSSVMRYGEKIQLIFAPHCL